MTLNATGTFRRTAADEAADKQQAAQNFLDESWKTWPNEAGFDRLEEHRGPIPLVVKGDIPSWAAGALFRTGPGQSRIEDTAKGTHCVTHWFDGFAQTHRFDIIPPSSSSEKTTVIYSSRRQSEAFVEHVRKKGWQSAISFGQRADPCVGIFAKVMSVFEPSFVNNNVTVQANVPGFPSKKTGSAGHRNGLDNVFIATDFAGAQQINPETLEPLGLARQQSLHPELKGACSCAHAQRDPETGDYFNYNLHFGRLATYRVFRVNAATGTTDILATIAEPSVKPAYLHSFFLTKNYVVLCVPSSHFGWNGIKIPWERNILDAIQPFNSSKLCRWIVVDRRHGKGVVARFSTPAGFFFHSVNAFEEQVVEQDGKRRTDINLDVVMYDNLDILTSFYYDVILDRDDAMKKHWVKDKRYERLNGRLARYRIHIPASYSPSSKQHIGTANEILSIPYPHVGELPSINPVYATKPYRYVYSTPSRGLSTVVDALAKTDLHTREATIWSGPKGHSPGEPIFVARPGAEDEDDGVLLSVVVDGVAETSYLLCLDARTMEEVGRAEVEFAIGMGFHGLHAPAAKT